MGIFKRKRKEDKSDAGSDKTNYRKARSISTNVVDNLRDVMSKEEGFGKLTAGMLLLAVHVETIRLEVLRIKSKGDTEKIIKDLLD